MHLLLPWLRRHDPGYAALRRAARTAIVMPTLFALGVKVIGNPLVATFAAFGAFSMLLLVDFGGSLRQRVEAHVALAVTGAVLVCLGTLASRKAVVAAVAMAVVAFAAIFAGVVSSVLAGASTALLLAFILPVTQPGPLSSIPDRLAGWALASVVATVAVVVLWPAPARNPLRGPTVEAMRGLADRIHKHLDLLAADSDGTSAQTAYDEAVERSDNAVAALRRTFISTPYRPTGLSTGARTLVRLVDELSWLDAIVAQVVILPPSVRRSPATRDVKRCVATLLDAGADLLADPLGDLDQLEAVAEELRVAVRRLEDAANGAIDGTDQDAAAVDLSVSALEPGFRALELSFAASQVASNVALTVAADRRGWLDRLLGHQPGGLRGPFGAAQERAAAHVDRHSVWLRNSIRGAVALGLAVLVADLSGVQHSFWVVLATLSVLRSSALNTSQNVVRGLLGTLAGFVIGALLVMLIGTNTTVLWVLLPVAILVAGVAPAAISFAAGQAAFTVTLVILFNIIAPTGWHVGLVRVEDIAIGCLVSVVVGLLFWPRGATSALRHALAEAYTDAAHYLAAAVEFGMGRCDSEATGAPRTPAPAGQAMRSAAAARRLDDTWRGFLAERGPKRLALAQVTGLVTGVVGLRLAADAVLDLWQRDSGEDSGVRTAARTELLGTSALVEGWYDELAAAFRRQADPPQPLPADPKANDRLLDAVRRDLRTRSGSGCSGSTAARMVWTGDHLDAARRLQATLDTSALDRAVAVP